MITLSQEKATLSNINHAHYIDKTKGKLAVEKIREEFEEFGVINPPSADKILEKNNSVSSYYVTQWNIKTSGPGTESVFKIKWHFYESLSFLGDFVTLRLTHSKLGRRKISDRKNDNLDPSTAYPKHTQVPTINQKKKTDATEDVMKGLLTI